MMRTRILAGLLAVAAMTEPAAAADPVLLHSAGSLRFALTEVAAAFEQAANVKVQPKFGPSGTLKEEIAGGGRPHHRARQHRQSRICACAQA
jgi:ABC-type molybdate transport system substrate-binding protein